MLDGRTLDFLALGLLCFVVTMLIYGIIYIHDIPYEIAKKRKHPHQDAIHTAGWVSLFLMHTIWPFLWIWATLYKPGFGWGFSGTDKAQATGSEEWNTRINDMEKNEQNRVAEYEKTIASLQARVTALEEQSKTGEEA